MICSNEIISVLVTLFAGVWGAGTETTKQWFAQGYRTLDDLRTRARLTRMQQIGLKYYKDFNTRIPREEVTRIETIVNSSVSFFKQQQLFSLFRLNKQLMK